MFLVNVSWPLFFILIASFFIFPEHYWGSLENYCVSIVVRVVLAIIFIFIAAFSGFGKDQLKRYFLFIGVTIGIGIAGVTAWTITEQELGFQNALVAVGLLALLSLTHICVVEKLKVRVRRKKSLR